MTTILACTDGSVYAPSIYDHAAWAAGRLQAGVQVLHMIEHPAQPGPNDVSGAIGFDASAELMAELVTLAETQGRLAQAKARAVLQQAQEHLAAAGVTPVSVKTQHGSLVDALPGPEVGEHLVVIGKRGEHADFAKLHLGSNLERVIRASCQPVLVASRRFESIERFLLAYDGSPSVLKAIEFLLQSPLLRGLHCHLLRAGKIDDTARYYLEETAGKLRAAGATVTTQATPGSAEEVIAAAVREQRSNLLVMGAYGHSRIRRFIVGSTTTATIRTVSVPVLLFR
jgi:nucleotide-binding universal stress UspA family protein